LLPLLQFLGLSSSAEASASSSVSASLSARTVSKCVRKNQRKTNSDISSEFVKRSTPTHTQSRCLSEEDQEGKILLMWECKCLKPSKSQRPKLILLLLTNVCGFCKEREREKKDTFLFPWTGQYKKWVKCLKHFGLESSALDFYQADAPRQVCYRVYVFLFFCCVCALGFFIVQIHSVWYLSWYYFEEEFVFTWYDGWM